MKEYLWLNVPKPWFQMRAEIKVPPLTTSYGSTGTAFDYAMRFYLQKLNPSAKVRRWLAGGEHHFGGCQPARDCANEEASTRHH